MAIMGFARATHIPHTLKEILTDILTKVFKAFDCLECLWLTPQPPVTKGLVLHCKPITELIHKAFKDQNKYK